MCNEFKKADFVVYGKNGVCEIEDVKTMDFAGEKGEYYILKPQSSQSSTVYVPLNKETLVSKMRPVMTKKQIDDLLASAHEDSMEWIEVKNERLEKFNSIVSSGDSKAILTLIMCIYLKKQEREALGKHLSSTDDNILRVAMELIEEEISFALGCSLDKVTEYIKKKIK